MAPKLCARHRLRPPGLGRLIPSSPQPFEDGGNWLRTFQQLAHGRSSDRAHWIPEAAHCFIHVQHVEGGGAWHGRR